ncbi:MAG: prepilin peptidase [Candidatus Margulisiibacteriota bacterium]|nr:prepilin peptidase [Candidatus Margulisiibacteriota bacterium]
MLYFIIGTVVGSFLNVCIHRLPREESIVFPPSHCPRCKHKLSFFDLVPIVSYFILRGKCRYCGEKISFRYPLVELVTGLLFALIGYLFPIMIQPVDFFFSVVFIMLLMVVFFVDHEQLVIPDSINIIGVILGLLYNFLKGNILSALSGMLLAYSAMFLIAKIGKLSLKRDAMGEGDLYLSAFLGAVLGWKVVLLSLFIAYLIAGATAVLLLLMNKVEFGQEVPFGGALAASGIISFFYGQQILAWYFGIM